VQAVLEPAAEEEGVMRMGELRIENCPDVCERAYWQRDDYFSELSGRERGQYNCPHHYGVTYAAAIIDGKINCEHFKRKKKEA